MNKYRKEYCEENGMVKINPENTKLYDYIKHLENKLEQAENERLREFIKDLADSKVIRQMAKGEIHTKAQELLKEKE